MSEFTFVDELPPATLGRNTQYARFREALRENEGRWGIHPAEYKNKDSAQVAAANINRGSGPWSGFEAHARDCTIYVRFVGGAE